MKEQEAEQERRKLFDSDIYDQCGSSVVPPSDTIDLSELAKSGKKKHYSGRIDRKKSYNEEKIRSVASEKKAKKYSIS